MGIQDRDYYREGPSFLDRVSEQGGTVWLIAVTCGVFFGQMLSAAPPAQGGFFGGPLTQRGAFDTERILDGEVWRLFTSMFLHSGIFHIFFNMMVLYFAGQRLEADYGSRELVMVYLTGGVFANLFRLSLQAAGVAAPSLAIGASGATTALLIIYAFRWPHQRVLFFFVLPMPVWLLAVVYVGLDTVGAVRGEVVRGNPTAVGHLAHLGGALFGFLYYQTGFEFRRVFARKSRPRARPRLRVVPPPTDDPRAEPVGAPVPAAPRPAEVADEQLEARLDAVLAKVSKHGQESLTPEEREILFKASELYKKRRK